MSDEQLTTELAVRAMGWRLAPGRYLKPGGWTSRSGFRPLVDVSDAFRALEAVTDEYSIVAKPGEGEELKTIGDHLRRRRLVLKPLQRQVAAQLGVTEASIYNWEGNRSQPHIGYMAAIIRFLGYNPLPPGKGWAERLVQCRTALGITQKESARRMGVDQGTLARWERGEREPAGQLAGRASKFLLSAESSLINVMPSAIAS